MVLIRDKVEKKTKKVHPIDAREAVKSNPERFEIISEEAVALLDAEKKVKEMKKEQQSRESSERALAQIEKAKKENEEKAKKENEEEEKE